MLDKYEADWILNELAELRRDYLEKLADLNKRVENLEDRQPLHDHDTYDVR